MAVCFVSIEPLGLCWFCFMYKGVNLLRASCRAWTKCSRILWQSHRVIIHRVINFLVNCLRLAQLGRSEEQLETVGSHTYIYIYTYIYINASSLNQYMGYFSGVFLFFFTHFFHRFTWMDAWREAGQAAGSSTFLPLFGFAPILIRGICIYIYISEISKYTHLHIHIHDAGFPPFFHDISFLHCIPFFFLVK